MGAESFDFVDAKSTRPGDYDAWFSRGCGRGGNCPEPCRKDRREAASEERSPEPAAFGTIGLRIGAQRHMPIIGARRDTNDPARAALDV
jgi:hypothetical protein